MDESTLVMAEALTESLIAEATQKIRDRLPHLPPGFDGLCIDCGEPVPAYRISFGASTCIDCQELRELRASLR